MTHLLIHAGMHKTGTTTIQALLRRDAPHLLAAGDHHYHVARRMPAAPEPVGPLTLFSSESLFPWIDHNPQLAQEWASNCRSIYSRITVLLFLRRQDHLMESIYAEAACRWHEGPFSTLDYQFSHLARIKALSALFGINALQVGIFRDDMPGWDVTVEFQRLTGITLGTIERHNQRLHRRAVLFMAQLPKHDRAQVAMFRRQVGRLIRDDGERCMFSPYAHLRMLAEHQEDNRAICRRWCPGDEAYMTGSMSAPDTSRPWQPPAPLTIEEQARWLT